MKTLKTSITLMLLVAFMTGCNLPRMIQSSVPVYPSRPLVVSESDKILVANVYNVNGEHYRDNKEDLFKRLLDNSVDDIALVVKRNSRAEVLANRGLTRLGNSPDSTVEGIMEANAANHAILVKSYNAYFEQMAVDVTRDENGKSKTASYDIIVDSRYQYWRHGHMIFDTLISVRNFHSSRSVLSGLLAAGPSIVSNAEDAREGTRANVDLFMRTFFEMQEDRTRPLFTAKDFQKVGHAIDRNDFNAAFTESEKMISSKDNKIKSRGYYNCAVLLERNGEYTKAKLYLDEALNIYPLSEAQNMLFDYQNLRR